MISLRFRNSNSCRFLLPPSLMSSPANDPILLIITSAKLFILQWNVSSIKSRLVDLQSFFVFYPCSILVLSEIWLFPKSLFSIPNYKLFLTDRLDGYGSSIIAINKCFKARLISLPLPLSNLLVQYNINFVGVELFDFHLVFHPLFL